MVNQQRMEREKKRSSSNYVSKKKKTLQATRLSSALQRTKYITFFDLHLYHNIEVSVGCIYELKGNTSVYE